MSEVKQGSSLTIFIDKVIAKDGTETATTKTVDVKTMPQAIGHATSYNLEINADPQKNNHKGSGGWECNDYGMKSWSLSCDGFEAIEDEDLAGADLTKYLMEDKKVNVYIANHQDDYRMDLDGKSFTGRAVITSTPQSATAGEALTYSISMVGDGALKEVTGWTE